MRKSIKEMAEMGGKIEICVICCVDTASDEEWDASVYVCDECRAKIRGTDTEDYTNLTDVLKEAPISLITPVKN